MMNIQIIETERLILKGLTSQDMKYIFAELPKNEIMNILGHRSEEDYKKEEFKHQNGYSSYNRRFLMFLLTHKPSGLIIGRCGLHNWNSDHRRAEIGYVMEDERFKRQGLMSEAVEAIIQHGFKEMNLNRIEAMIGVDNMASIKIIEKNHFIREGLLRQHICSAEKTEDSAMFSLLREDYAFI